MYWVVDCWIKVLIRMLLVRCLTSWDHFGQVSTEYSSTKLPEAVLEVDFYKLFDQKKFPPADQCDPL